MKIVWVLMIRERGPVRWSPFYRLKAFDKLKDARTAARRVFAHDVQVDIVRHKLDKLPKLPTFSWRVTPHGSIQVDIVRHKLDKLPKLPT